MIISDHFRIGDRKMAIFGYQHVQYLISRQRIRIKKREMFCWKALVISFSKIYKLILQKGPSSLNFFLSISFTLICVILRKSSLISSFRSTHVYKIEIKQNNK
jgi:hypothetical protein